jgi:ribosomal protein S18 acetylase RimI-like enzyme
MMQDETRRVFVAEQKGEVVGYVVLEKKTRPPVLAHSHYGAFGEICVAPAARRTGVGEALVAAGLKWFEGEGLSVIEVGYAANNPMSVPFWEGQGFRPYMISGVRELHPDRGNA